MSAVQASLNPPVSSDPFEIEYVNIWIVGRTKKSAAAMASAWFLRKVRQLCDDNNIVLIADEVSLGLGRLGSWLGMEQFGTRILPLLKCRGTMANAAYQGAQGAEVEKGSGL